MYRRRVGEAVHQPARSPELEPMAVCKIIIIIIIMIILIMMITIIIIIIINVIGVPSLA